MVGVVVIILVDYRVYHNGLFVNCDYRVRRYCYPVVYELLALFVEYGGE